MMIRMMSVSCMTCVVMCSDELFIPYAVGCSFVVAPRRRRWGFAARCCRRASRSC